MCFHFRLLKCNYSFVFTTAYERWILQVKVIKHCLFESLQQENDWDCSGMEIKDKERDRCSSPHDCLIWISSSLRLQVIWIDWWTDGVINKSLGISQQHCLFINTFINQVKISYFRSKVWFDDQRSYFEPLYMKFWHIKWHLYFVALEHYPETNPCEKKSLWNSIFLFLNSQYFFTSLPILLRVNDLHILLTFANWWEILFILSNTFTRKFIPELGNLWSIWCLC